MLILCTDACYYLLPCTASTCGVYCKQLGYKEPKTGCWRTFNPKVASTTTPAAATSIRYRRSTVLLRRRDRSISSSRLSGRFSIISEAA